MSSASGKKIILSMAMAMDKNKLLGKDNSMPWHIPGEQVHFKAITMGKPIIMGRKTFDSIGRPLPGRPNFVVTRNREWQAEGVIACLSLEIAIEAATKLVEAHDDVDGQGDDGSDAKEIVVIGGAGLCREAMPITDRIYLTHIDHAYDGDVWFDSFNWDDWRETSRQANEHEGLKYDYLVLDRI